MNNDQFGMMLACLCCLVPWLAGFVTAWGLSPRVRRYGWKGAFIPHRLIERIAVKIQEEE